MRYPLPRRATLPRLPAVLQTHRSRWTLSALRRTRRTCRSHYLTRRSCRFSYPQACAFPQRRGSPAPPPQESYYGGVSLPSTEIILTGGPYLSIEVGRSPLSKPLRLITPLLTNGQSIVELRQHRREDLVEQGASA